MNNMLKSEIVNHFFEENLYMEVEDEMAINIYDIVATFTRSITDFDLFFKNIVNRIHDVFYEENDFYYKDWIDRLYCEVVADYDDQRLDNMDMLDEYINNGDKDWLINALLEHEGTYKTAETFYIDNTYGNFVFLDSYDTFIEKEERASDCLKYDEFIDLNELKYYNNLYYCVNELYEFIRDYNKGDYNIIKWFNKTANKYDYYIFDNVINNHRIEFKNIII